MSIAASKKSTTGRSYSPGLPLAVRAGVGALEAVAPALAERVAERLFMTPPRHPQPAAERAALEGAEPFALDVGGTTVRGRRMGEGPAVLLVHGWGGRGGQLAAFAPPLVAAGCAALVFDAPGHGESGGRTADLPRVAGAIRAVAGRFGARAAVAHSFGAAALTLALHRGLALDAAVLIGAPRTPRQFLDSFCAALGLGEAARDRVRRRVEQRVGIPVEDLEVPRLASPLEVPSLVVHDRADAEVPFADGAAIAAAWTGARLLATDGLGHRRILRHPAVVGEVASFVVGRMARCGCGRLAAAHADGAPRCETCLLELHLAHREERAPRGGLDESVDRILRGMENAFQPSRPV
jgi:predicted alpha/beta hydrolase family esterase